MIRAVGGWLLLEPLDPGSASRQIDGRVLDAARTDARLDEDTGLWVPVETGRAHVARVAAAGPDATVRAGDLVVHRRWTREAERIAAVQSERRWLVVWAVQGSEHTLSYRSERTAAGAAELLSEGGAEYAHVVPRDVALDVLRTAGRCDCGRSVRLDTVPALADRIADDWTYRAVGARAILRPIPLPPRSEILTVVGREDPAVRRGIVRDVPDGHGLASGDTVLYLAAMAQDWDSDGETWVSVPLGKTCRCGRAVTPAGIVGIVE